MIQVSWLIVTGITWLATGTALIAGQTRINIGVTVPFTSFRKTKMRDYAIEMRKAFDTAREFSNLKNNKISFSEPLKNNNLIIVRASSPYPEETLHALCEQFMKKNVSALIYLSKDENYGVHTSSSLYFLHLADFLRIPVLSWIADNSAMEQRKNSNWLLLQFAPSIHHQTAAMLSILRRYNWDRFSVITTLIPGNKDFELAVREEMEEATSEYTFDLLEFLRIDANDPEHIRSQMERLTDSETRIILLYATQMEAVELLQVAAKLGLTGTEYVWIVTQSVLQDTTAPNKARNIPAVFPVGLFGVGFNTTDEALISELYYLTRVIMGGLDLFLNKSNSSSDHIKPNFSCVSQSSQRWKYGEILYEYMRNVSIRVGFGKPNIEFDHKGVIKNPELSIFNLNNKRVWNKIGKWANNILEIDDIVWPENSPFPPAGKPTQFHVKATFLEEPPYINLEDPDPDTNQCLNNGVLCKVNNTVIRNGTSSNTTIDVFKCCSGFCVDLLTKLSGDIGFTFDLVRIEDGFWGSKQANGSWNGLIAALLNRKTDIVITSLKINSQREEVIDFSVPFLETGIAILVAKRTGIVSPSAFLEPFDALSWILVIVVTIQVVSIIIFVFEWISPLGFDRKMQPPKDYKFSVFRSYWLVWTVLFRAPVDMDWPRGVTSRIMAYVWSLFTLVFTAMYTANLAAFMITREEFYDLSGIKDRLLEFPLDVKPPFRFGTVHHGNTETLIKDNFPEMHNYMRKYVRKDVKDGIHAVKKNILDAFIYDSTVLEYLAARDDECRLLTVGSWYAKTGYGVAFPPHSKYLSLFNQQMLLYKESGELERLQKFWFTGACHAKVEELSSSHPLGIEQFISAFVLLSAGILLAVIMLSVEHCYFWYVRRCLAKFNKTDCCNLISMSLGRSLTFREAVDKATTDIIKCNRCQDHLCNTYLMQMGNELLSARQKIKELEALFQHNPSSYPPPVYKRKKSKSKEKEDKKKKSKKFNSRLIARNRRREKPQNVQLPTEKSEIETFI